MDHLRMLARYFVMAVVALGFLCSSSTRAQERLSDKDIETQMNNLKEDSKKFRSSFNSAVEKSTVRKTTREKDSKELVSRFQKQCEEMLDHFKDTKKADTTLPAVLGSAREIEKFTADVPLGDPVSSDWSRVRAELDTLAKAFPGTN